MEFGGSDPNLYAYVQNDPVSALDPYGTDPKKPNWDDYATRACTAGEMWKCEKQCGGKDRVESCKVQMVRRTINLGPPQWVDSNAAMSCSCKENSCNAKAVGVGIEILFGVDLISRILFPPRNLVPVL